jgi:hypothetical protein
MDHYLHIAAKHVGQRIPKNTAHVILVDQIHQMQPHLDQYEVGCDLQIDDRAQPAEE